MADPYAHLKDNSWRAIAEIEARLDRGEIDEDGWHAAMSAIVVPAYLAGETPWAQSGRSGGEAEWEWSRSLIADAIDRDGTFLDVGCANGFLMECIPRWTRHRVEVAGLEIAPELADLARRRLPSLAGRIWTGNAAQWTPPTRFTYIRAGLEYVPDRRRRDFVSHLADHCDRLILGVFNEESHARPTEDLVRLWGFPIAGRTERVHRTKAGMSYRAIWIDNVTSEARAG